MHSADDAENLVTLAYLRISLWWMFRGMILAYGSFSFVRRLLLQCGCCYTTANDYISLANLANQMNSSASPSAPKRLLADAPVKKFISMLALYLCLF